MRFCRWRNIFAVFLISIAFGDTFRSKPDLSSDNPWLLESKLTAEAVEKALAYLEDRPTSVTGDVVLGILLGRENLEWTLRSWRVRRGGNPPLSDDLEKLIRKCDDIIELVEPESLPILNKTFWRNAAGDLNSGALRLHDDEFRLPEFHSCQGIDDYMMNGTPEDSDLCMNDLFRFRCDVSDGCWLSEANGGLHSGYKTTHRLLYFQAAAQLECDKTNPRFSGTATIIRGLCQQILWEARALFRDPHFLLTQDLFMEQVALCGLQGFEEFAPETWRKVVRSLQSNEGCFGQSVDSRRCPENSPGRKAAKRGDALSDECHTHVTAVAIPAMTFFLRCTLKAASDLP